MHGASVRLPHLLFWFGVFGVDVNFRRSFLERVSDVVLVVGSFHVGLCDFDFLGWFFKIWSWPIR